MSFTTGHRLARYKWTALSMPQDVTDRVHTLARAQNNVRGLIFMDSMGNTSDEIDEVDERLLEDDRYPYEDIEDNTYEENTQWMMMTRMMNLQ
jgi:hypothetical protein